MPAETGPSFLRDEITILPVSAVTGVGDGAGAITLVDSFTPGYRGIVEKIRFISSSIATGAGGTQTYKLRKGGATGTVIATLVLTLATVNAVGKFVVASVAAAAGEDAKFRDSDTLSLTRDAGGTAFTKLEGSFTLIVAQRPQSRL